MYIIETEEGKIKAAAKGVSRHIKDKHLKFADYEDALFNSVNYKHAIAGIRQKSHQIFTEICNKVTLSPFNDKKWITRDGNIWTSFSHGNYKIASMRDASKSTCSEEMDIDEELVDLLASCMERN